MSATDLLQPLDVRDLDRSGSFLNAPMQSQLLSTAGASEAIRPRSLDEDVISIGDSSEIAFTKDAWKRLLSGSLSETSLRQPSAPSLAGEQLLTQASPSPYTGIVWNGHLQEPLAPLAVNAFTYSPTETTAGYVGHIPFVVGAYANYATRMLELGDLPQEARAFRNVNVQTFLRLRVLRDGARAAHARLLANLGRQLDHSKSSHAGRAPRELVTELSEDYGLNQLSTARAVGVTPTAVRKWRRGEQARSEYQDRLALLRAMLGLLRDTGKEYPASWLEVPVSTESVLTPLDLFAAGRPELVLALASEPDDVRTALDDFDPDWRRSYAPDREYTVVVDPDGERAVVPRDNLYE